MTCDHTYSEERFREVQRLAYFYWVVRGRPYGSPEVDWLRAEQDMALVHFLEDPKTRNY